MKRRTRVTVKVGTGLTVRYVDYIVVERQLYREEARLITAEARAAGMRVVHRYTGHAPQRAPLHARARLPKWAVAVREEDV